jgi:hypothetical protein
VGEILIALFTTTFRGAGKVQDRGMQIILWIVIIASFSVDARMHTFPPVDMPQILRPPERTQDDSAGG